ADVGQRLKLVEVNVWQRDSQAATGQTIFEIDVTKDMCNIFGTLHGGCAAYMIDPCSVSSLVVLGNAIGIDGTGVSQSMNLIWHQPARIGASLKIISTSIFIHGRVRSARCEVRLSLFSSEAQLTDMTNHSTTQIWNGDQLCVTAIHSTVNPWTTSKDATRTRL
ncbi:hypothetical protein E4T56_gene14535, partial [Termitomyces sp. T112]